MLPDKVSVTATMSVIRTGAQHASAIASVKEVTCYVEAEQKLVGLTVQAGSGGGGGASWGQITGTLSNQTDLQTALNAKANTADLGDLASKDTADYVTDITNKPTLGALSAKDTADYATDVTNKPTLGALAAKNTADYATDVTNKPTLGTMASVDDAASDSKTYGRKNGNWVEVTGGGGGGSTDWGDIGGTLSDQTDLQTALDAKADKLDLAEEFDATKNYYEDACVIYNNVLYVFDEYKAAGVWDSTKVTQLAAMPIVDRKLAWKANVSEIAPAFETSQSYSAGDYVSYDGHLFQFVADKAAGAWDWNKAIPRSVYYVMNQRLSAKPDSFAVESDFDPTHNYIAGNTCMYQSRLYRFSVSHTGAWNSSDVTEIQIMPDMFSRISLKASKDSPTFTGTPEAPTPTAGDSSTKIATTAFVQGEISGEHLHISMASTSSLGTISNASITTTMRVVNIVWGTPANVLSDVTWNTNTAGQLVLSGTLAGATTAEIDLIDFG